MKSIAIDFGGTQIKIALVEDGRIFASESIPARSENGLIPRLIEVERTVRALLQDEPLTGYAGLGIALPGIVDVRAKRLVSIHGKYEDAIQMDIVGWGKRAFGFPEDRIYVDMDAAAALLGEMHYGCGDGATDIVMMIIGTGVGAAATIDGRLIRGKHYQACLGGHMIIDQKNHPCTCGGRGCLEANASGWAIKGIAQEMPDYPESLLARQPVVDFKTIDTCAEAGDAVALALIDYCNACWSAGILGLVHAFDPELVILSGGVMRSTERIFKPLAEDVIARAWTPWGKLAVRCAEDPDLSVCLGLHSLVEGKQQ